jgi:hypothetical protein
MTSPPNPAHLAQLIETVAGTSTAGSVDNRRSMARAAIEALQPRDIVEAMLAARIIAAHHATMDGYQRAAQPGISDAVAVRLRNNAIAAARSFDAAMRMLEKRRAAAEKPARPPASAATGQPGPRTQPPRGQPPHGETVRAGPDASMAGSSAAALAEGVANRQPMASPMQARR